jgi:hypothetical protein
MPHDAVLLLLRPHDMGCQYVIPPGLASANSKTHMYTVARKHSPPPTPPDTQRDTQKDIACTQLIEEEGGKERELERGAGLISDTQSQEMQHEV